MRTFTLQSDIAREHHPFSSLIVPAINLHKARGFAIALFLRAPEDKSINILIIIPSTILIIVPVKMLNI